MQRIARRSNHLGYFRGADKPGPDTAAALQEPQGPHEARRTPFQNSQPTANRPIGCELPVPRATPPDTTTLEPSKWCTRPKAMPPSPLNVAPLSPTKLRPWSGTTAPPSAAAAAMPPDNRLSL